jgi:DHA1 family tetracycline resistance protein-like MFS transporter
LEKKSILVGLAFWSAGFFLYSSLERLDDVRRDDAFAMGGIAGPAIQSVMTQQVGADEQGELQGGITSIFSMTSILGLLLPLIYSAIFLLPMLQFISLGSIFSGSVLAALGLVIAYLSFPKKKVQPSVSE